MSHFFLYLKSRKRIILPMLLIPALFVLLFFVRGYPLTENGKFDRFTEEVFRTELGGNTLSLHYTVADPARYGLEECAVSLGDGSLSAKRQACASAENHLSSLKKFRRDRLSRDRQLTCDIFLDYLETELSAASLLLYDEPLSPTLGIQAQLPVLLAEYPFRTKGDIEDYLTLLSQMPDYFASLISFEQEKSHAGLFMSDDSALQVISQCQDFIADPENNYLIEIFDDKIDAVTNLTADEKIGYKSRNRSLLSGYVIPAYETLISGVSALLGTGKNEMGLYYLPAGTQYYEYLVKSIVGDDRPVAEIEEAIKEQMVADYTDMQTLLKQKASEKAKNDETSENEITAKVPASGLLPSSYGLLTASGTASAGPAAMLTDLREKITTDFPLAPGVSCNVKYVHDSLQDYLSPAFYLTPAIDNYTENVIYINPVSDYSGLELYTTLAHEGYPGHLYQSVYFNAQSPALLRTVLDTGGYVEGWATYVEMYSYSLWEEDSWQAAVSQKNRSFTLGLASLLDIGIHYHGYSPQEVSLFLEKLGFDSSTAESLYQSILQSPANYLQYFVGYLNFCDLRDEMKAALGEKFSLKEFHTRVLQAGPAPFSILKAHLF